MGQGEEEVSKDIALHRDLGDLKDEVDSIGVEYCIPPLDSTPSLDRYVTFTSKLSLYCLALYNTLSLMEKEALNSSSELIFTHPLVNPFSRGWYC
jgi:hypothetical protein